MHTGTEPSTSARAYVRALGGHDGCTDDDAGHILANQLGGKATPTNLFPQSPHLNRGAWESFERAIAACFASGGSTSATLKWSFQYESSSKERPKTASYAVTYDQGCASASQSFSNACTSADEPQESAPAQEVQVAVPAAREAPWRPAAPAMVISLNLTCIGDGRVPSTNGCIVHTHGDGAYALARDRFAAPLGQQLDVVHLHQSAVNGTCDHRDPKLLPRALPGARRAAPRAGTRRPRGASRALRT